MTNNKSHYQSNKWSGKTRGGTLGNWIFLSLINLFGIRSAYTLLLGVAAYYLVASPRSVKNSYRYLNRVVGPQPAWKWPFLIYRNFFSLGMSLLDKSAIMMGSKYFNCVYENEDSIFDALKQGKGVILVGAHVGNWAVGGQLLNRLNTRINIVMLENEVERVQRIFDRAYSDKKFRVLSSSSDLSSSLAIMKALQNGEIVVFNGDRTVDGVPKTEASFFGDVADFPLGAYQMATVTESPVIMVFAMRDRIKNYRFFCYPARQLSNLSRQKKKEAIKESAKDFAGKLQSVLTKYPFQWYNFHPFWKNDIK